MSKRARPDEATHVPEVLLESGMPRADLARFLDFLADKGLCIADDSFTHTTKTPHIVYPEIATGYKGCHERIVCRDCCDKCPCCGNCCDDLYDNDDAESPHEWLCYTCMHNSNCQHDMPEQCSWCHKGCRELFGDKQECRECADDDDDDD